MVDMVAMWFMQVNAVVGYPASIAWWTKGNRPNMREINSAQEFVEAIANAGDKLVLVDFYSVACRSCKALHPKVPIYFFCKLARDIQENLFLLYCLACNLQQFLRVFVSRLLQICQIAADNPDIEVLKVNFYDNNALCRSLNVNILPFFHFYRGKEGRIDAFSCSLTKVSCGSKLNALTFCLDVLDHACTVCVHRM